MKGIFYILIFSFLSITFLSACNSLNTYSNPVTKENMKNIEFIPKEFHDVKLDLYDGTEYPCTPRYPKVLFGSNIIWVNAPQNIIYRS